VFTLLLASALAAAPDQPTWNVEIDLYSGTDAGREIHGDPLAYARFGVACSPTDSTPRWTEWTCRLVEDHAVLAKANDQGLMMEARVDVDPRVVFEARWTLDGRLKRFRPRGPEPTGLADWVYLGLAALAVPTPPGGWDTTRRWLHDNPSVLNLAGEAPLMARSLELTVVRRNRAVTKLDVFGGGVLDSSRVAEVSDGAISGDVSAEVTGTIVLDGAGDVQARSLAIWLHPRNGTRAGNVGSQRIVVKRDYGQDAKPAAVAPTQSELEAASEVPSEPADAE
jgi:hypothetical protein